MNDDYGTVTEGWWRNIDRSDWPEHRSVDFGGVLPDGNPLMQAACPGCGLYRENDDDPSQHFIPGEPDCSWALERLRWAEFSGSTHKETGGSLQVDAPPAREVHDA